MKKRKTVCCLDLCVYWGCNWGLNLPKKKKKILQLALNLLSEKTISLSSQQNNPNIPDSPNQQSSHKESEKETDPRGRKKDSITMLYYVCVFM